MTNILAQRSSAGGSNADDIPGQEYPVSFFSNEGNPREPIHIHSDRGGAEAKLWLFPEGRIVEGTGFTPREQTDLVRIVASRRQQIMKAWHEHFG
ncbi:MAG: DUF4160 domain-containing protein [Acetobacteraceae bacterium]